MIRSRKSLERLQAVEDSAKMALNSPSVLIK